MCNPEPVKRTHTCEYCGITVTNPGHVCKPRVSKLSYVCDACGKQYGEYRARRPILEACGAFDN